MERRKFLKVASAAGMVPATLSFCAQNDTSKLKDKGLSAFIFSDAHIGWTGKDQPTLEVQSTMISRIKQFFPNLDLVFDTGDVHHGNLREAQRVEAREFWLQEMAGQFPNSLMHYIPGNHELGRGASDAEDTVSKLGSMAFRPYYSFDYKGIHFISLPQLIDTILISEETINWLKQDLLINAGKSTIILSHNSLSGTTYSNGETGYRVTVNSEEIFRIIKNHGKVLAWFHGHNHQYEVVLKDNIFYVSNGRIGGFNPPKKWGDYGQGHLGGVFFHIDADGITIKCFSATENNYLSLLGYPKLSQHLSIQTSFDPTSPVNYYCGHGKITSGVKYRIHNHYLSKSKSQLIISQNLDKAINENSAFNYGSKFHFAGRDVNRVIGFQVRPNKTIFNSTEKGLELTPASSVLGHNIRVCFPVEKYKFKNHLSRSGYYRCALGERLNLTLHLTTINPEASLSFSYKLMTQTHHTVFEAENQAIKMALHKDQTLHIELPTHLEGVSTNQNLYFFGTLKLKDVTEKAVLKLIQLSHATVNPTEIKSMNLQLNKNSLNIDNLGQTVIDNKYLFESGKAQLRLQNSEYTYAVTLKLAQPLWQIRNAIASLEEEDIIIEQMRSDYQTTPEIILTPTTYRSYYISKLFNLVKCRISIQPNQILLSTDDTPKDASISVYNEQPLKTVSGGTVVEVEDLITHIKVNSRNLKLEFVA